MCVGKLVWEGVGKWINAARPAPSESPWSPDGSAYVDRRVRATRSFSNGAVWLGRCVVRKFAGIASRFMRDEEGATLLEYGMLVLLITVLSIVFISSIGQKVSNGFSTVNSVLP